MNLLKWLPLAIMFPSIKRTDPEQIFVVMKNNHSVTLVEGDFVQMDTAAAAADLGNAVVGSPATISAIGIVGAVHGRDIPVGSYGKIMTYGVHNNLKGLAAINAVRVPIQPSATALTATIGVLGTDDTAHVGYSLTAVATGRFKGFLRCM